MTSGEVKKRVVIASVLKPVNDTRMTEKIGRSLADTGKYDVHVIGFPAEKSGIDKSITAHPLPHFKRLSFKRVLMSGKVRSIVTSLKPDLLIIGTHELLIAGVIAKMMTGCKLIYDVQENYYLNIRNTNAFPPLVRNIIAAYVRLKERLLASTVDHFFLAEQNYQEETDFFGQRFTVIENKVRKPNIRPPLKRDPTRLLFSGTLSESTGVFIAIDLAIQLHEIDPAIHLTIIGYSAQRHELDRIKAKIRSHPFIDLIGGGHLVPHEDILGAVQRAGAGIISYPPNISTSRSVPTKLFEYLGHSLPILMINNPFWVAKCQSYQAAVVFETQVFESRKVLQSLKNTHFYPNSPTDVFWESEENKVIHAVKQLL